MNDIHCSEVVAALLASIESGTPLAPAQREHLKTCTRCAELLDSARQFQTLLSEERAGGAAPRVDDVQVEREVRAAQYRQLGKAVGIIFLLVAAAVGLFFVPRVVEDGAEVLPQALLIAAGMTAASVIPLVVLFFIARYVIDKQRKPIYRRLDSPRWWLGVCAGLGEATTVQAAFYRLAFFVLFFFDGVGLFLYIAFALAMPVHPDDRHHLWRFQARRMLASFRGAPDGHDHPRTDR